MYPGSSVNFSFFEKDLFTPWKRSQRSSFKPLQSSKRVSHHQKFKKSQKPTTPPKNVRCMVLWWPSDRIRILYQKSRLWLSCSKPISIFSIFAWLRWVFFQPHQFQSKKVISITTKKSKIPKGPTKKVMNMIFLKLPSLASKPKSQLWHPQSFYFVWRERGYDSWVCFWSFSQVMSIYCAK